MLEPKSFEIANRFDKRHSGGCMVFEASRSTGGLIREVRGLLGLHPAVLRQWISTFALSTLQNARSTRTMLDAGACEERAMETSSCCPLRAEVGGIFCVSHVQSCSGVGCVRSPRELASCTMDPGCQKARAARSRNMLEWCPRGMTRFNSILTADLVYTPQIPGQQ